jgi:hypothetical protein
MNAHWHQGCLGRGDGPYSLGAGPAAIDDVSADDRRTRAKTTVSQGRRPHVVEIPSFTAKSNASHSSRRRANVASGLSVLRRYTTSSFPAASAHTRPVSSLSVIITANNTGGTNHLHFEPNTWFKPLSNLEVRGVSCGLKVISRPNYHCN